MTPRITLLALAGALACSSAFAEDGPPPGQRPNGPPPEAIAACNGKTAGATVSFTGRRGETISGTCTSENGVLAARPQGGPPGRGASAPTSR